MMDEQEIRECLDLMGSLVDGPEDFAIMTVACADQAMCTQAEQEQIEAIVLATLDSYIARRARAKEREEG